MIKQYVHSGFSSSLPSEGTMFWPRIHVQKKPTDRSKQHSVVFLYLSCWKFHHWFSIPEPWRPWQISWTKKETQISSATSASKLDPCIRKKSDQNSIEVNIHFLNVGTGLAEVVGRKGKQWWVKPTLSWTYDRNRNQGKGSTMKQYLVVEVCRRGIDAASFSSALKQNMMYIMYIYISSDNDFQDPHKSSQLMSTRHEAQRSLLLGRASTLPPHIAQRHIWQWHIINQFTIPFCM